MKFKEFLQMNEEGGTDRGLMGFGKSSSIRKPSDGQPFKNLSSVAGQEPRGSGGAPMGGGGAPMFMKKMKKQMAKI